MIKKLASQNWRLKKHGREVLFEDEKGYYYVKNSKVVEIYQLREIKVREDILGYICLEAGGYLRIANVHGKLNPIEKKVEKGKIIFKRTLTKIFFEGGEKTHVVETSRGGKLVDWSKISFPSFDGKPKDFEDCQEQPYVKMYCADNSGMLKRKWLVYSIERSWQYPIGPFEFNPLLEEKDEAEEAYVYICVHGKKICTDIYDNCRNLLCQPFLEDVEKISAGIWQGKDIQTGIFWLITLSGKKTKINKKIVDYMVTEKYIIDKGNSMVYYLGYGMITSAKVTLKKGNWKLLAHKNSLIIYDEKRKRASIFKDGESKLQKIYYWRYSFLEKFLRLFK